MPESLEILAVHGIGEVTPGTDLADVIASRAPWLRDGDVLVVTSKIVSKAEGRLVDVPVSGPERDAVREELLTAETARPVARRGHTRIVQTHHGFVLASAGIDASNVERSRLVLLPKDPDASARGLRAAMQERMGLKLAVIVSDTMGRPWRNGLTDVALGLAGMDAVKDHRGETDPYGNVLQITQMAVADELAGAAELVKGKCDHVPVAVVRGYLRQPPGTDGTGAVTLVREAENDLFTLGTAEARAAGLREASALADAPCFGDGPVDVAVVAETVAAVSGTAGAGTTLAVREPSTVDSPDLGRSDPLRPTKMPANTACVVAIGVTDRGDPHQHVALGVDIHRLRCALAAGNLAATWLPAPDGGHGLLAVGAPAPARLQR